MYSLVLIEVITLLLMEMCVKLKIHIHTIINPQKFNNAEAASTSDKMLSLPAQQTKAEMHLFTCTSMYTKKKSDVQKYSILRSL